MKKLFSCYLKKKTTKEPINCLFSEGVYLCYCYKPTFSKDITVCTGEDSLRMIEQAVLSPFPTAIRNV